jgi:hypothetical protein
MQNGIPSQLTDFQLVEEVTRLASYERRTTAALVAHLAELEARRLYLSAGFSSMFAYCTQALRLSEGGAYNRIEVSRAVRRFPVILELMEEGALTLANVRRLAPHLTEENHRQRLAAASYKRRHEVEDLLALWNPRPDVASSVRRLPPARPPVSGISERFTEQPCSGERVLTGPADLVPQSPILGAPTPELPPQVVTALAPDRYQVRFTASAEACQKLREAQDLLRHAVPSGDVGEIFDRALTALLGTLVRKKFAAADQLRPSRGQAVESRNIPAEVKRAVVARDRGSCAFVGDTGRRCGERGFLEFHHVVPHARGGAATIENIQLRCRPHNGYEGELRFGPRMPPEVRKAVEAYEDGREGRWGGLVPGQVRSGEAQSGYAARLRRPAAP